MYVGFTVRFNAPLIPIDCFHSVQAFVNMVPNKAALVCVELTGTATSLHSWTALELLKTQSMFLVVGSENKGVHSSILRVSSSHTTQCIINISPSHTLGRLSYLVRVQVATASLEIPALSASINVGMAFMSALTAMQLADATA